MLENKHLPIVSILYCSKCQVGSIRKNFDL